MARKDRLMLRARRFKIGIPLGGGKNLIAFLDTVAQFIVCDFLHILSLNNGFACEALEICDLGPT